MLRLRAAHSERLGQSLVPGTALHFCACEFPAAKARSWTRKETINSALNLNHMIFESALLAA
jgi:hypothetical protein